MNIIVPMAGRGSRLRPHTLTTPKPLLPVAGMPIVSRLVRDIVNLLDMPVTNIGFVLGDPIFFGDNVVVELEKLAKSVGAKAHIFRQFQALGTGHAIMCAEPLLSGPTVIAYADTLIRANFHLDTQADATIWVNKVKNPQAYGVVELNNKGDISGLVEKPESFVSDLAVIGIYYFKEAADLKNELMAVLQENLTRGGEYQINDGILRMIEKGKRFTSAEVSHWMDCGNPTITIKTNQRMLQLLADEGETLVGEHTNENSTIIPPCFIAEGVVLHNSTVGPYVSIGKGTRIENSTIENSIIQSESELKQVTLKDSMIGNHVKYNGSFSSVSLGDFSELK
jgi:glucose-1-phosphate thymidylyltransferase